MGPVKWYFDTSVVVPAAVTRHPHNATALAVLEELISRKHRGFISAHSLTETYSVLTRTPHETGDAHANGISGGGSSLPQKVECDRIHTFNVKDFRALAPAGFADKVSAP